MRWEKWRPILAAATGAALAAMLAVMPAAAQEKFKAVTTFTVIADMAKNVAGDAAIVESITKPGAEIHNYAPTPGDIQRGQGAKLILWNGLSISSSGSRSSSRTFATCRVRSSPKAWSP